VTGSDWKERPDQIGIPDRITPECAGCTPIETPGPRWSAYVFDLRGMGLSIETINEPHDGPFSGTHARYVLHSSVTRAAGDQVAA
jgi:hypothetical protein